jgi:hypothetical protein
MIDSIAVFESDDAKSLASDLFYARFRQPFPVPRDNCGLTISTPPESWHQYVATYGSGESRKTIGFVNFIRYDDAYLEGGLCVDESSYRRMDRDTFLQCRARGGIAQMLMETAAKDLNDRSAWFGYVGDRKSMAVTLRSGYERTAHPYIIVKWFRRLPELEQQALLEKIAAIGPF